MIILSKLVRVNLLPCLALCGLLAGCLGESKVNNEEVTYVPEQRALGVIAGDNSEHEKGQTITLSGRLVGTVTNQTILWEQTAGTPITGVADWTVPNLTFPSPDVNGLETFKFKISARDASGNIINGEDGKPLADEVEILVYDPSVIITLEAEDTAFSSLAGGATLVANGPNYINGAVGSHTADITPGGKVVYQIPSGSTVGDKTIGAGFYTLFVRQAIPAAYGGKEAGVKVNGVEVNIPFVATSAWVNTRVDVIKINEGDNTIEIGGGWNYYRIDSILLIPAPMPAKPIAVSSELVNKNATAATKDIMTFLVASYGAKTISGQTEFMDYNDLGNKTGLRDFNKVVEITGGKSPAIVAFDLMDYSSSRINCGAEPGTLSEDMINEHNEKNVILSPLWHWNAPTKLIDADCNGTDDTAWYAGFYTRGTTFDLTAALADTNGADYQALISDMDDIAAELKKFADADIPLLWRPLHEAEGGWFWWGAADAASLKALWVLMYERFTDVHQLNNLIWVYTHAGNLSNDWYPGNEYVDIVGYDGYDGNNADNPFKAQFSTLKDRFDGKKLVALTEVGTIPNIEIMHQQNAWWNFFITWSSEFSTEYGPQNADVTKAKASYEFAGTLNLDDVPGGRVKVEAGLYEGFEFPVAGWSAQVSWTDGPGATVSSDWSAHALYSLSVTKDLSAETNPTNVVLQVYPTGGIDVTGNDKLSITVNTANAGTNSTAYVFVKHGDDWEWASTSAISANNATIEISVADYEWLAGVGVVFEGFDASSTAAKFYLDAVQLDNETLYDFEGTGQWEFQTNWSPASGLQLANDWKKSGEFSLAGTTQLQAGDDNIILQVYPTGGVLLGDVTNLKVSVHAKDTGNATQVQLFAKDKDLVWKDSGAVPLVDGSADLSLDISTMGGELSGFGVRFMGPVNNATESTYYIDDVSFE